VNFNFVAHVFVTTVYLKAVLVVPEVGDTAVEDIVGASGLPTVLRVSAWVGTVGRNPTRAPMRANEIRKLVRVFA
jgi:hypothetical protein